tara:strand:- start:18192 stop:18989 length:798 start_codon:yes stop_codon:yes gene_type:complete
MPLISKGMYQNTSGSGDGASSEFRNPNSIWRNTVRIRPGEHAVLRFVTDFTNGDMSRFHGIPGVTPKGQQFTSYEYCNRLNVNESGPVISTPCEHCVSGDERIAKTTSRYLTWVFHYGTFHMEQNPFLDRDGQEPWDLVPKGNKQFYRETVKKPQLLNTSFTLFKNIEEKYDNYSSLLTRTFDYRSSRPSNITQYALELSDTQVQTDYAQEILDMENSLPDLELIAAKLITELELPSFNTDQTDNEINKEDAEAAYTNMANIEEL